MTDRRLPYGTRVDPVKFGIRVERRNKDRFDGLARDLGLSSAALFDLMVENLELDDQGRPTWLPDELPKDGELPM